MGAFTSERDESSSATRVRLRATKGTPSVRELYDRLTAATEALRAVEAELAALTTLAGMKAVERRVAAQRKLTEARRIVDECQRELGAWIDQSS